MDCSPCTCWVSPVPPHFGGPGPTDAPLWKPGRRRKPKSDSHVRRPCPRPQPCSASPAADLSPVLPRQRRRPQPHAHGRGGATQRPKPIWQPRRRPKSSSATPKADLNPARALLLFDLRFLRYGRHRPRCRLSPFAAQEWLTPFLHSGFLRSRFFVSPAGPAG